MSNKKINVFHALNDTDKWVFAVDGYYQLFDKSDEIKKLINIFNLRDIEGSPHGDYYVMSPRQHDINIYGEKSEHKISDVEQTNIGNYLLKAMIKQRNIIKMEKQENMRTRIEEEKKNNPPQHAYPPFDLFELD